MLGWQELHILFVRYCITNTCVLLNITSFMSSLRRQSVLHVAYLMCDVIHTVDCIARAIIRQQSGTSNTYQWEFVNWQYFTTELMYFVRIFANTTTTRPFHQSSEKGDPCTRLQSGVHASCDLVFGGYWVILSILNKYKGKSSTKYWTRISTSCCNAIMTSSQNLLDSSVSNICRRLTLQRS